MPTLTPALAFTIDLIVAPVQFALRAHFTRASFHRGAHRRVWPGRLVFRPLAAASAAGPSFIPWPLVRRLMARVIGFGVGQEHVAGRTTRGA